MVQFLCAVSGLILDQQGKQGSMFERNKDHLAWRKNQPALTKSGRIEVLDGTGDVIAFNRATHDGADAMLCLFNFTSEVQTVDDLTVAPWSAAFR